MSSVTAGGGNAVEAAANALAAAMPALHRGFMSDLSADDSGCTALAALCTPGMVHVASAGDCRCVLWRTSDGGEHQLVTLNEDMYSGVNTTHGQGLPHARNSSKHQAS